MALGQYKASGEKAPTKTIASLSVEELRGKVKVTSKAQEDGTFVVKVNLGVLPVPTYDGAKKFEGVPADVVEAEIAELERDIAAGMFDVSLVAVQAQLAVSGEKAKASREAKKAAKDSAPATATASEAVAEL